jgi:hypothetical protein
MDEADLQSDTLIFPHAAREYLWFAVGLLFLMLVVVIERHP